MNEQNTRISKPYVITIAGYVGSGKSTIAESLARELENAPVLKFDHYENFIEWSKNMNQWTGDETDLRRIRIPRLKDDLLALLKGLPVSDPLDGRMISPSSYVLLEEPSGRERDEIKEFIDFVVYIDVPQDVCVTRLIERVIDMEMWNTQGTFTGEAKENLVKQLNAVVSWINHYRQYRSMYMAGSELAQRNADIVVNGMLPVEEIIAEILSAVMGLQKTDSLGG